MKIKFLVLVSLFFSITFQSQNKKELKYGVKAGMNYAQFIHGHDTADEDSVQFHFGVFSEYSLNKKIQFVGELLYNQKRGKDNVLTNSKLLIKSGYLEIPISVKYEFLKNINVIGGPQVGFLIKKDGSIRDYANDNGFDFESNDYNNIDVSLNIGLIFDINSFFLQPKYNHGLTKVLKNAKYKNKVLSLSLGYRFN